MRIGELVDAVESYGVQAPKAVRNYRITEWWQAILNITEIGSGQFRDYTGQHVRRIVAWQLIGAMIGPAAGGNQHKISQSAPLRRQATRLLAAAPEGWVIMADGRAWWSLVPPVRTLRSRCAVAIPVPDWRH